MIADNASELELGTHDPTHIRDLTQKLLEELTRTLEREGHAQASAPSVPKHHRDVRRPSTLPPSPHAAFEPTIPVAFLPPAFPSAPDPEPAAPMQAAADFAVPRILRRESGNRGQRIQASSQPPDDRTELPIPIPTVCRAGDQSDIDHWFVDQLRGAPVWIAIGLSVMLIAGVFQFGAPHDPSPARAQAPLSELSAETANVTQPKIDVVRATTTPFAPNVVFATAPLHPGRRPSQDQLAEAHRLITLGDLKRARDVLNPLVAGGEAQALLALAETYDPNVLASLGSRDEPNVSSARTLYGRALAAGVEQARVRLEALN